MFPMSQFTFFRSLNEAMLNIYKFDPKSWLSYFYVYRNKIIFHNENAPELIACHFCFDFYCQIIPRCNKWHHKIPNEFNAIPILHPLPCLYPFKHRLTQWDRDKFSAIPQSTFSNAFSWMNVRTFRLRCSWNLFIRFELIISLYRFRKWLGADQATSHYFN